MVSYLDYFTAWTDIIFICTILFCICFPRVLPLWFWIGVACLMTTVGVIGSLVFSTIHSNSTPTNPDARKYIVGDFLVHILPVIVLFFFYRMLEKRFYVHSSHDISALKSAMFPFILGLIYICTHNVEVVYQSSDLSSYVIIILALSVWLSSYEIFIPKKCL